MVVKIRAPQIFLHTSRDHQNVDRHDVQNNVISDLDDSWVPCCTVAYYSIFCSSSPFKFIQTSDCSSILSSVFQNRLSSINVFFLLFF